MVIIDEFYTCKKSAVKLIVILNFKIKTCFLYCILFVTKVKQFQGSIGRNLMVLLKNGKKIIQHCERVRFNSDFMVLNVMFI